MPPLTTMPNSSSNFDWQCQLRIRKALIILDEYQRIGDYRLAMRHLTHMGLSDSLAHNILTGETKIDETSMTQGESSDQ